MKREWGSRVMAVIGFAALMVTSATAQTAPPLRTAESFAVLAPLVISTGPTKVTGDLGASVTGFPPGTGARGRLFSKSESAQPLLDAARAYGDLAARGCEHPF